MDDSIDFTEALTAGLAAAEDAARAMVEIKSVVEDAARSVEAVYNSKLSLYLDATSVEKLNAWTTGLMKGIGMEPKPYVIGLHAIFVGHLIQQDGGSRIEKAERICLVRFGVKTYPVIVEWEDTTAVCNDVLAVRVALAKVLRDARVARTFHQLAGTYPTDARLPKQLDSGNATGEYVALIATAKQSPAGQNVEIHGNAVRDIRDGISGTISIGMMFDKYFELRIPLSHLVGIPICKIPYSDIEWATIDPSGRLDLRLKSTIVWNGRELSLS